MSKPSQTFRRLKRKYEQVLANSQLLVTALEFYAAGSHVESGPYGPDYTYAEYVCDYGETAKKALERAKVRTKSFRK